MKKALGKGLSALIPDSYKEQMAAVIPEPSKENFDQTFSKTETVVAQATSSGPGFQMISVEHILPNEDQPRQVFDPVAIDELANSIREKGILQPVIVKRTAENQYRLICGERRFRAAKACGLASVPAVVKDIATEDFLEWALIENIQRQDLNPLEEAEAYQRLVEERMISQEEVAKRVGKNRTTVTNTLRLLRLPDEIKAYMVSGQLSAGHARALLGMLTPEHQRQMAKRIVEENLSVRQVELIVTRSNAHKRKAKTARHLSAEIVDLENRLVHHLGAQVKIYPKKNQKEGRIEIHYTSLDDLDRMLQKVGLSRG
ncbi:MAG TPA: ParB/RepB/Spo0J family partition protein [Candidatus Omnitrophota bacterium]|nr:ParB/RepB/Spo0J family partition protein [Candidatus Omnitrophota bacterium]HPS36579.1 ParB/RepB/Spo0J family partition protein [Candidatus Omnitrophota bacterium]